jgi:hypothetical protein
MQPVRARSIKFTHEVRVAPEAGAQFGSIEAEQDSFFQAGITGGRPAHGERVVYGEILVDKAGREVIIKNPNIDRLTGKPLIVHVPLERVVSWEPMTPEVEARMYPTEEPTPTAAHVNIPNDIKEPRRPTMGAGR